jgi:hypothetical protein
MRGGKEAFKPWMVMAGLLLYAKHVASTLY